MSMHNGDDRQPTADPAANGQEALELLLRSARILVVDDEPANVLLLERILERAGYVVVEGVTDPRQAGEHFERLHPDLVLLDLHMPHIDGFTLLAQLRARIPAGHFLPVLVLTADITPEAKQRALADGANDFLNKPLDHTEVVLRVRNLLHTRFLHLRLQSENLVLGETVRERTRELEEAQFEILERLTHAAEFRDDETGMHTRRVGEASARIADALGMDPDQVELLRRAAPLHDVGKIGIPDAVLLKPGRLTEAELRVMRRHTEIGARLLSHGRSELIRLAEQIALAHHERWDGTGYPAGRQGEEIPLPARIVALADFFDALAHNRPYRTAWPRERIIEEIQRERGRHFDARVVDAFLAIHEQIQEAR